MPSLTLKSLSKSFVGPNGRRIGAVNSISLDVEDGELLAIVGTSASGKTTLLRLIAGLETPDHGQLRVGNDNITQLPPQDRNVAMVFQTLALYPHMTTAENIGFGLRLKGQPSDEIRQQTTKIAARLDIEGCLSRRPYELSGGQQQRVALARALVRRPGILLLDEPLSHLDGPLRRQLCRELKALHEEFNLTTLLVTHDLAEAEVLSHRIAVMNRGRIEQVGAAEALRSQASTAFVAEFMKPGLL